MLFTTNSKINWNIDADGFLRCKTAVMRSGVMIYTPAELGYDNVPSGLRAKTKIFLYVPEEEVQDAVSLKSLEGRPVSLSHDWKKSGDVDRVGNVAGAVTYDDVTNRVMSDILVDDPRTIKKITDDNIGKLEEQSAAYTNEIEWGSGYTDDGEYYDGIQRSLRYNHIMLLPRGEGRAGEDIRIINKSKKGTITMSEFTSVKVGDSRIRVFNEDVEKLADEVDKKDDKMVSSDKEADDAVEKLTAKIKAKNEEVEKILEERDNLSGKVSALQEQLDELNDPEAKADSVAEAVEEQQDSEEIMNEQMDDDDEIEVEVKNSRKLFGHKLRTFTINAVRKSLKKDLLTDDEVKNESFVSGVYSVMKSMKTQNKSKVAGAKLVKSLNQSYQKEINSGAREGAYSAKSAEERKILLYGNVGDVKNG